MKRSKNRANTYDRQAGDIVDAIAPASYDAGPMTHPTSGQTNLTALAILLGTVITAVWVWKRLSLDTQDYLIDQAIPIALLAAVCARDRCGQAIANSIFIGGSQQLPAGGPRV